MIRWYDYPAAFIAADFFFTNILRFVYSEGWFMKLFAALGAYAIWHIWETMYTPFRIRQEANK